MCNQLNVNKRRQRQRQHIQVYQALVHALSYTPVPQSTEPSPILASRSSRELLQYCLLKMLQCFDEPFTEQIVGPSNSNYLRVNSVSIFGQERGKSRDVSYLRLPSAATYCPFWQYVPACLIYGHCIYSDSFATIMKTNLKNRLTYTGILASTTRR